ncbi:MAG: fluoride efflux transporter CrcB [Steroidobacteraceae bacterium]
MWKSILAVAIGAGVGAVLRWWLSAKLNAFFPTIPPGTLASNLIGAYVIGAGIAFFAGYPAIPAEWRLMIVTGFCGGLTTFSTFSAELVGLLRNGRVLWAAAELLIHVTGSLLMTLAGMGTVALFGG